MSLFFDRETLETIRDIIRETMSGNVAIVLLTDILPGYMAQKDTPSIAIFFFSALMAICIKIWTLISSAIYLSELQIRREKLALIIFTLWSCLFIALAIRYFIMFYDIWTNQ